MRTGNKDGTVGRLGLLRYNRQFSVIIPQTDVHVEQNAVISLALYATGRLIN